jgi:hypothetical protein
VLRLGVPPTLARTLRNTNSIESMISIARAHSASVKNWQKGTMALRWCAAGMVEASKQFRRVNGHLHLPALRAALDEHVTAQTVGAVRQDEPVIAALTIRRTASEVQRNAGHPRRGHGTYHSSRATPWVRGGPDPRPSAWSLIVCQSQNCLTNCRKNLSQ